jgi:RNA-directed DNA polymerase
MESWNTLPWQSIQRKVCTLPRRIYRAAWRDAVKTVRKLQRLLMPSWAAKLLAVRKVTQDKQGNKTPGVDGSKS